MIAKRQNRYWSILLVLALVVVGWTVYGQFRFHGSIEILKGLKSGDVSEIEIRDDSGLLTVVNDADAISSFIEATSDLEKYSPQKASGQTRGFRIALRPHSIVLDAHIRQGDDDVLYGYLGVGNGSSFVSYGSIRSEGLRRWLDQVRNSE